MSGGYCNHFYYQLEDHANDYIEDDMEMYHLMKDLAKVHYDLEWWKSGDIDEEHYLKTLDDFKNKWFKQSREIRLREYIDEKIDRLKWEIERMIGE